MDFGTIKCPCARDNCLGTVFNGRFSWLAQESPKPIRSNTAAHRSANQVRRHAMQPFRRMLWFLMLSIVIPLEVAYPQSDSPDRLAVYSQTRQGLQSAAIFGLPYPPFGDLSVV